jgi:hypothetical protein
VRDVPCSSPIFCLYLCKQISVWQKAHTWFGVFTKTSPSLLPQLNMRFQQSFWYILGKLFSSFSTHQDMGVSGANSALPAAPVSCDYVSVHYSL